jgi:xanthine dehydrogenase small subunit
MEPGLTVNGRIRALVDVGGHVTLLEWLRAIGLTGCKEGCAEGECGACAVLVNRPDDHAGSRWTAVNACLVPAAAFDGQEVITAEGLGTPAALHPVQRQLADRGGSQCGYCTPGFVCAMAAEYYRPDRASLTVGLTPSRPDTDGHGRPSTDHEHGPNGFDLHALSGNLCRCTGYRPIRDAAYALSVPESSDPLWTRRERPAPEPVATRIRGEHGDFVRPLALAEALDLLADNPDARLLAGATDWGVDLNLRHVRAGLTIAIDRLPELRHLSVGHSVIEIGAALTFSEIERGLAGQVPILDELFPQFASRLIRNGATLGGNLGTASPIGDAPPVLLALESSLVLASRTGEREVELADYFTGYRQTVKRPDELIKAIRIPLPLAPVSAFHKIAKRRFDDISSVAVAFALRLAGGTVERIRIGLGGVAAQPIRALATEEALTGRPWTAETVRDASVVLGGEGTPITDHRASAPYRAATLRTSLLKFHAANPALQEVRA